MQMYVLGTLDGFAAVQMRIATALDSLGAIRQIYLRPQSRQDLTWVDQTVQPNRHRAIMTAITGHDHGFFTRR